MWCKVEKLLADFLLLHSLVLSDCGLNVLSSWCVKKQNKRHMERDRLPRWAESTLLSNTEEEENARSFTEMRRGRRWRDDSSASLAVNITQAKE